MNNQDFLLGYIIGNSQEKKKRNNYVIYFYTCNNGVYSIEQSNQKNKLGYHILDIEVRSCQNTSFKENGEYNYTTLLEEGQISQTPRLIAVNSAERQIKYYNTYEEEFNDFEKVQERNISFFYNYDSSTSTDSWETFSFYLKKPKFKAISTYDDHIEIGSHRLLWGIAYNDNYIYSNTLSYSYTEKITNKAIHQIFNYWTYDNINGWQSIVNKEIDINATQEVYDVRFCAYSRLASGSADYCTRLIGTGVTSAIVIRGISGVGIMHQIDVVQTGQSKYVLDNTISFGEIAVKLQDLGIKSFNNIQQVCIFYEEFEKEFSNSNNYIIYYQNGLNNCYKI